MSTLEKYYEDLFRCNRCGFCQANCRVYKLVLEEDYSARGRLALIRSVVKKKLSYTNRYAKVLNTCLQCKECSVSCPSGVHPAEIILAAREDWATAKGLPLAKRIIYRNILASNTMLKVSIQSLRIIRKTAFKRFAKLNYRGIALKNISIADRSFATHQTASAVTDGRQKVAFFIGCSLTHLYPQVAETAIRIVRLNGFEVVVPNGLHCCGMPIIAGGDTMMARRLALINLTVLNSLDVDTVTVACSSCGLALKEEYPRLLAGTEHFSAAERLAGKVKEISVFLSEIINYPLKMGEVAWRVTYHDPCHLIRGLGIRQQPRMLLKSVPGLDYVELPEADRCCGGAGMFQISYPELAGPISRRKIENIARTQAGVVVTQCPVCMQRIQTFADLGGIDIKAMHLVEVLDEAYRQYDEAVRRARRTLEMKGTDGSIMDPGIRTGKTGGLRSIGHEEEIYTRPGLSTDRDGSRRC